MNEVPERVSLNDVLHASKVASENRAEIEKLRIEVANRAHFESEMRKDRDHLRTRLQEAAKLNVELQADVEKLRYDLKLAWTSAAAHRDEIEHWKALVERLQAQIPEQVSLSFVLYGMLREPGHIPQYRNIVAACFPDWTPDHVNQFIDSALIANGTYKT